jgi:uncharacterized protein involved in exopolysaccharide biosynthesis
MSAETPLLEPWLRLTVRRWRVGLVGFWIVLLLGGALLFLTRPVHRSDARLRLGSPPPASGVSPMGGFLSFLQLGGDPFANDLELLGSRSLAEAVVEGMALNASLVAPPGWHRDSLLVYMQASRETAKARYTVRRLDDLRLELRRTSPSDSSMGEVLAGVPVSFGGLTLAFKPHREGMPLKFDVATVPFPTAARIAQSRLRFERPRREANVVAISYNDPDPGVANGAVAATVAEFIRLRTDLQHRESTQSADSLRTVARRTEMELRAAEVALEELQRTRRLVAPAAQSEALVERQGELLMRVALARAELQGIDWMLDRLGALQDPSGSWTALLSYPSFLQNETLGSMLVQLTGLQATREELATRRTPENRELLVVDRQIAYLDRSLRQMAQEYRSGLADQIAAAEPELRELDTFLANLPGQAMELGRAERAVRLLSEVLILTEQRLRQEELREALTYANVQVVDPPALRDRPIWPRKKLGMAVVVVLASGFGFLGMVVRDATDPRLRRAAEVEGVLGRPLLATVGPPWEEDRRLAGPVVEAMARRAGIPHPPEAIHLVPVGHERSARELAEGAGGLRPWEPVRDFRAAAKLAAVGAPAVLLVEAGITTGRDLMRTARLIHEAGGSVAGAILVCRTERELRRAWD